MNITIEAIYENGVLKPAQPLPFKEPERVKVTISSTTCAADKSYGLIGWTGDAATFDRLFKESEADRREPTT